MSAPPTARALLVCGALLGAAAVMSGAFGAHALEGVLTPPATAWYETAVTYHAGHALAILACALLGLMPGLRRGRGWAMLAGLCFVLGILIFSGSLYTMAFTGHRALGMITPIGGVFLILGWLALAVSGWRIAN